MMFRRLCLTSVVCLGQLALGATAQAATATSAHYPIMLHYDDGVVSESYVQTALSVAEDSWDFTINQLQMPPPPADADANGSSDYDIFLEATRYQAVCHAEEAAADRDYGFTSIITIDSSVISDWHLGIVLAHEFHHAVQIGMRRMNDSFMEGGSVFVTALQRENEAFRLGYNYGINAFQQYPERSLDWSKELGNFYPYGTALFLLYLEQQYGDMDELTAYRSLWQYAQTHEDVSYLAAVANVAPLDEAFVEFCRWRYFVGPNDDARHLTDLSLWEGPSTADKLESVALFADIVAGRDFPYLDDSFVMPFGVRYVRVEVSGLAANEQLQIRFEGHQTSRWRVQSMLLTTASAAIETDHAVGDDGTVDITLDPQGRQFLVLALVNLGDGQYTQYQNEIEDFFVLSIDKKIGADTDTPEPSAKTSSSGCNAIGVSPSTGSLSLVFMLGVVLKRRFLSTQHRS